MITGVECAGLILAVLPLVTEAAKVYSEGVEDILDVVRSSRSNEKLEEFYENFFWEVSEFEYQIKQLIDALPKIPDERKSQLVAALHTTDWGPSSDIDHALHEYFTTKTDFMKFDLVMKKCVKLIGQLLEDEQAINIKKSDLTQEYMFQKLKYYAASNQSKQASSRLRDRYRFRVKEKDREKCLQALKEWNVKLHVLIERAQKEPMVKTTSSGPMRPSGHLRDLSRALYRALSNYWNCGCTIRHEARFCLKPHKGLHKCPDPSELGFNLLFSAPKIDTGPTWGWQEGKVVVRSRRNIANPASNAGLQLDPPECDEGRAELEKICDVVEAAREHGSCVQLLVEVHGDQLYLWQLPSQPRQLYFFESAEAVPLRALLRGANELPLKEKRMLALILAYSLLQLCGSPWLNETFSKEEITFFYKSADEPDYERPYISTRFDESQTVVSRPVMNRLHRNPSLLSLGILLLELHKERPIEHYRKPEDLINGTEVNVNTDFAVADREVKRLRDCSLNYQEAMQACLDIPWKSSGRVSLDDPVTRNGVYDAIIRPLEDELKNLFRESI